MGSYFETVPKWLSIMTVFIFYFILSAMNRDAKLIRDSFCQFTVFSWGGEIRHDNKRLSWSPLPAFYVGSAVLESSIFSDFGLAGIGLLKISLYGLTKVVPIIRCQMVDHAQEFAEIFQMPEAPQWDCLVYLPFQYPAWGMQRAFAGISPEKYRRKPKQAVEGDVRM